ncbi:hypothetical protein Tco_0906908, partial [Tanacetum coccineum]
MLRLQGTYKLLQLKGFVNHIAVGDGRPDVGPEHSIFAGIHPNANLELVEYALATRLKWEAKSDKHDLMDLKVMPLFRCGVQWRRKDEMVVGRFGLKKYERWSGVSDRTHAQVIFKKDFEADGRELSDSPIVLRTKANSIVQESATRPFDSLQEETWPKLQDTIKVRDSALNVNSNDAIPKSDVNREYFTEENDRR